MTSMRMVRYRRAALLLGALQLLAGAALHAQTPGRAPDGEHILWRVKGEKNMVYILGSVHALSQDMYPLDSAIERAYLQAGKVVFEVNMDSLETPAVLGAVMSNGMLPPGKNLKDVVSKSTYKMVEKKFKSIGMELSLFSRFKPWVVAFSMMGLDMQKSGYQASLGIDSYFHDKATADGKEVGGLETAEYQIRIFDNLSDKAQEALLRQSAGGAQEGEDDLPAIMKAWSTGDLASLEKMLKKGFAEQPDMYTAMVVTRNNNWVPQVESFLKDEKNHLVVVGALHLVGAVGVIEQLKAKGYQVERL